MLTRKLKVRCNLCGYKSEGVRIVKSEDDALVLVECSAPQHSSVVNRLENQAKGFGREDVSLVEMSHEEKTFGGRDLAFPSQAVMPTKAEIERNRSAAKATGESIRARQEEQQAAFLESQGMTAEQFAAQSLANRVAIKSRLERRYPAPGEV
jgi:hypothetical protein